MGIISNLLEKRSAEGNLANPSNGFLNWLGGGSTSTSGRVVTPTTALQATAVFACVKVISETFASLPLVLYRRLDPGKKRAPEHPAYSLLHDSPNPEMTAFTWKLVQQSHLLLWGNCYSEIEWGTDGYPKALWPLRPDQTWPERDPTTKQIVFKTVLPNGQGVILPPERVLHIPGLGGDGLVGYSPIRLAMESVGMALAAEEFTSRFFSNGARPAGVITHPGKLDQDAKQRMKDSWQQMYSGLSNAHRVAILEQGVTYNSVGINPEDAQLLQIMKFEKNEIAGIYRVPPHMIADLEKSTNNNIEHQSLEFVKYTMLPWFVAWEQTLGWKIFTGKERRKYFVEVLVDAMLRGDIKTRYDAYHIARQDGILNADEWRALENMNPQEDDQGKTYFINGNMIPVGLAAQGKGGGNGGGGNKGND